VRPEKDMRVWEELSKTVGVALSMIREGRVWARKCWLNDKGSSGKMKLKKHRKKVLAHKNQNLAQQHGR